VKPEIIFRTLYGRFRPCKVQTVADWNGGVTADCICLFLNISAVLAS